MLWGGWLITGAVFFSVAGFFHEYYLSMLAAPLAALVGIGLVELWRVRARRPWLAVGLMLLAAAATLALQIATATAYVGWAWWLLIPLALFGVGAILLGYSAPDRLRLAGLAGTAALAGAMLFTPALWSGVMTLGCTRRMALTTVNPSPGSPTFRSEIRTSNFCLLIASMASGTLAHAITSKPSCRRIAVRVTRIDDSSSTNRSRGEGKEPSLLSA